MTVLCGWKAEPAKSCTLRKLGNGGRRRESACDGQNVASCLLLRVKVKDASAVYCAASHCAIVCMSVFGCLPAYRHKGLQLSHLSPSRSLAEFTAHNFLPKLAGQP